MTGEVKEDLSIGDAKKFAIEAIKKDAAKIELTKQGEKWKLVVS